MAATPVEVPAAAAATQDTTEAAPASQANGHVTASPANGDAPAASEPAEEATDDKAAVDGDASPPSGNVSSSATPGSKEKKAKATASTPEHKGKKLNKKKSMVTLRLDCKPGEYYWARLKGYPPWPAIICDEAMLPESLLASRPVSTARPDGSIRDDFKDGGKNAKERTFPIMFLETNEFQWMVNTSLSPLDPEECKTMPTGKMTKALKGAYELASQNHDLDYFKDLLRTWQAEEEAWRQELAEAEAEALREAEERAKKAAEGKDGEGKEKPKKKASRKSKAADEDVEMEDGDAPASSKKRKKDAESDAEGSKPKKTPKITKLNAPKTPNGEAAKSATKPKRKVVTAPKEEDAETKPQLTEAEKLLNREKAILYLRHRLQKGFLARDQAPNADEMPGMADFFVQLEAYDTLEPAIIRITKIHKVLKAIVKLASVPKDEEYQFKKRSAALLEIWNKRMDAEAEAEPKSAVEGKSAGPDTDGAEAAEPDLKPSNADAALEKKEAELEDTEAANDGPEKEAEEKAVHDADQLEEKAEQDKAANVVQPTEPATDAGGDVAMSAEAST